MRSLHSSRRTRVSSTALLGAGVGVVALLLAVWQPPFLTKTLLALSRPFTVVRENATASVGDAVGHLQSKADVLAENERLTRALQKAEIKALLFDELREKMYAQSNRTTHAAHILSAPPFSPYDTLILDTGAHAGVTVGDHVSYDDTVALGVIDTVTKNTARVQLYSSAGTEQPVRVGEHDFLVTARGIGGGAFELLVLKEVGVERGDSIFTSDGHLLARVETVVPNETDAFATVYAITPFNLFEIREATIISTY